MAFAGLNVTFGFLSTNGNTAVAPIYGDISASHNMAVAGTSSVAAPAYVSGGGSTPMASVRSTADAWITVGKAPTDPSVDGVRRFIPANETVDFTCNPGDKVRWALA